VEIPAEVLDLMHKREKARNEKRWAEADIFRQRIKEKGFNVIDTQEGQKLEKI
jgi:cysteinyl-tRNA synthetase